MDTAVSVRSASLEDAEDVLRLWQVSGLLVTYNDPLQDFLLACDKDNSDVLLAEDADGLCGSVMVGHDGHRGWLYYLASAPRARGQGVGREMVAAAEAWLRCRGIAKLQILVRETNTAVIGFYERLGLEVSPRIFMFKWLCDPPNIL